MVVHKCGALAGHDGTLSINLQGGGRWMDDLVNFEMRRAREVFRGVYLTAAGNVVSIIPGGS